MQERLLVYLLVLALIGTHATAKIQDSVVERDDRKLIPLSDAFGFASGGKIEITIKDIAIYRNAHQEKSYNLANFGFFLSPVEADIALEQDLANSSACILADISDLFLFKEQVIQSLIQKKSDSYTFHFTVETGNLFYLYFANCEDETPVSFTTHIEMYNLDSQGRKDYLSVGDRELDTVFWVMFFLFTFAAGLWSYYMWQHKAHVNQVHMLMACLCGFKALTLLSQALMYEHIEATGYSDGWNIAYYIFTFFRGVLFFTVIVLIGTGWSYMKAFLGDREKRILMVVIPLQVFANLAIVITDEESVSVRDWFTWRDVFHLVDIVCCCAILFPIVWSIQHLREASQTDGKAARNLEKLTLFRQFYVMVVVYVYFTRIVVYLLKSTMQYDYSWVSEAADQMATLAFYVWTAVSFRPHDANPYLKMNSDEMEMSSA